MTGNILNHYGITYSKLDFRTKWISQWVSNLFLIWKRQVVTHNVPQNRIQCNLKTHLFDCVPAMGKLGRICAPWWECFSSLNAFSDEMNISVSFYSFFNLKKVSGYTQCRTKLDLIKCEDSPFLSCSSDGEVRSNLSATVIPSEGIFSDKGNNLVSFRDYFYSEKKGGDGNSKCRTKNEYSNMNRLTFLIMFRWTGSPNRSLGHGEGSFFGIFFVWLHRRYDTTILIFVNR